MLSYCSRLCLDTIIISYAQTLGQYATFYRAYRDQFMSVSIAVKYGKCISYCSRLCLDIMSPAMLGHLDNMPLFMEHTEIKNATS